MSDAAPSRQTAIARYAWQTAGLSVAVLIIVAAISAAHRLLLWGWPS